MNVDQWSFGQFLDEMAKRHGDLPAMVASDHSSGEAKLRRWTYAHMAQDVHALQWALMDLGVRPGERVAVMLSSFPEWVLYLFAVTRLGAAFVPVSTRFKTREIHHVLGHSGSRTLIVMGRYLGQDHAATIAEACGPKASDGRFSGLPELRALIGVGTLPHPEALDTAALLERGRTKLREAGAPPCALDFSATAILFYTSGTTSFPKGVPLSHANLLPHSVRCGELISLKAGEKVLTLYPFFGISGGANKVLSTFGAGACLVFQDSYRPEEACDLLDSQGCTVIHAVDVQIREMVAILRKRGERAAPERRGTIAFMASLDEQLARDMGEVLGLRRFIHPYGMTETNPMILRNELDDPFEVALRPGGRIAPGVEVRIVDPESGRERDAGAPGEIVVRGSTVAAGYFNDAEATAAAFRDGWFHTGDLGVRTAEGFLFYVGRLKDMLKVGGFNVAPQEVESLLRTHVAIEDVAVTGAPDARLGEVPVAFVRLRPGASVTSEALRERCRQEIANYKVPREVYFVDALPYHTAANGSKLQRQVLREWAKQRASGSGTGHEQ